MTVKELQEKLNLQYICNEKLAEEKDVTGCYCGDLLSWVMSRATEGDAWLTVMGNVTSIGVAVLADVSCIILTENAPADAFLGEVVKVTAEASKHEKCGRCWVHSETVGTIEGFDGICADCVRKLTK